MCIRDRLRFVVFMNGSVIVITSGVADWKSYFERKQLWVDEMCIVLELIEGKLVIN